MRYLLILFLLIPSYAFADGMVIGATSGGNLQASALDTYTSKSSPNSDNDAITRVDVTGNSTDTIRRALLYFDLSALPPSSTITSATLFLYYYAWTTTDPVGRTYNAQRTPATSAWVVTSTTFNCLQDDNHDGACDVAWSTGNGDPTAANGATAVMPASYGWVSWTVTDLVQDAVDSDSEISRIVVFDADESGNTAYTASFYSNDFVTSSLRPYLTVNYTY